MKRALFTVLPIIYITFLLSVSCSQFQRTTTTLKPATEDVIAYAGNPQIDKQITVIENSHFIIGYSESRKNPLWVAYKVTAEKPFEAEDRPSRFKVDKRTEAKVSHDDYTHSGYDRGHMAPNYAIASCYGREAQLETFLMSNICPQKPKLNRQLWRNLEMKVADEYSEEFEEVWIICGPIFDNDIEPLSSGVEVPDSFYKIVIDEQDNTVRLLAFIM